MAKTELCLDSSGEAECRVFQVRGNSEEDRDSPLPEDMLVAFHLLFVTCKYCAKCLRVPVTFNDRRKTCLAHRVSGQRQCNFFSVPRLIIIPYVFSALAKLFSFSPP